MWLSGPLTHPECLESLVVAARDGALTDDACSAYRWSRTRKLLEEVAHAGREMSQAGIFVHEAIAGRRGLTAVEGKALDIISESGPVTAGELAAMIRLKPSTVTGLVDRLERKGFARRVPHPEDKRRVMIEVVADRRAGFEQVLADYLRSLHERYATYTGEELTFLLRFLREMTELQRRNAARISDAGPGDS